MKKIVKRAFVAIISAIISLFPLPPNLQNANYISFIRMSVAFSSTKMTKREPERVCALLM